MLQKPAAPAPESSSININNSFSHPLTKTPKLPFNINGPSVLSLRINKYKKVSMADIFSFAVPSRLSLVIYLILKAK